MSCRLDEIPRDELLRELAPLGVTSHKLLRWVDAGLLPKPRRHGRGRAVGGSVSCYPRLALLQAAVLAQLLARPGKRHFDEAGWDLWVLGFPLTEYVRDLLLEELKEQLRVSKQLKRDPMLVEREFRKRPGSASRHPILRLIRPDGLGRAGQILAEAQLGSLAPAGLTMEDWALTQDVAVAASLPTFFNHPDLPRSEEVREVLMTLSRELNLPTIIDAVKKVDAGWLEAIRNELQWFVEVMAERAGLVGPLIDRFDFLTYFKRAFVWPEGYKEAQVMRRALGWTTPPPSSLDRLVIAARGNTTPPSTRDVGDHSEPRREKIDDAPTDE